MTAPEEFPEPERFDPQRFIGNRPSFAWIPFGGGTRRCVGAAFANVEMDVVLRTVLRHFTIDTTTAPDEKSSLPRGGLHAEGRRPHRRAPPSNAAHLIAPAVADRLRARNCSTLILSAGYWPAVCRLGSFQPGRMKWQVYPLG